MERRFDRTVEDLGNIVALEHVNVTVPDQEKATIFYLAGLGLTRDPYLMTGTANMWVNVGRSQFHLPTNQPQVVRGHTGIVVPDREALVRRLGRIRKRLEGTCFDFVEEEGFVEARCPWGNRIRCFAPNERFGRITLGIAYVEFDVPMRTADRYREVLPRSHRRQGRRGRAPRQGIRVGRGRHRAAFHVSRDRPRARALRRPSRPGLRRGLLRALPEIARQGPHHRGERPASVSIQRPCRSGIGRDAVHHRA